MKKKQDFDIGQKLMKRFICILFILSGIVGVYAQNPKNVTISVKDVPLKTVFDEITRQTGYDFAYSSDIIRQAGKISVTAKNENFNQVLIRCLESTGLGFKMQDHFIVISPKLPQTESPQQQVTKVQGVVLDKQGSALPGVTIRVKGTNLGVTSDEKGIFQLTVPENSGLVLVFSFIGMKTHEVAVKGTATLNIVMEDETTQIEEVVVTGIFQKNKEAYTGAVTVITDKELKAFGNKNLLTSISNIDPSFNILTNNEWGSDPNHLPEVQIRGAANLPDLESLQDNTKVDLNTPLIVLDGFEISLQRMMDLDDSEVASITLLKDGSATAIYGSRGANGVVVITTKEPVMGKLRLSYNGSVNIEAPDLTEYRLLNAREKLDLEERSGYYSDNDQIKDLYLKKKYSALLAEITRGVNTYWLSQPLRTGVGHRHNIKLEGGDKSFRYSASLQYNGIAGVMKESNRNTFNGGINLSYYRKGLIFRNNLSIGINKSTDSPYGTFSDYAKLNPYWAPYDEDGKIIKILDSDIEVYGGLNRLPKNPMYNATLHQVLQTQYTNITNNFSIEWKPFDGFIARGRVGISGQTNESDNFKPAKHTDFEADQYQTDEGIFRKGRYAYGLGKSFNYDLALTLSYAKVFAEKHSLYAGLNVDLTENRSRNYNFVVEGFVEETLDFLSSALQYEKDGKPTGSESKTRRMGIVGNINYAYDNRYYLDCAYRTDGSSQFGKDKKFAPFYSIGLGWNLHNENFMKNVTFVNRLKIRGSYGQTGSQKFNAYQAMATYNYYMNDRYFQWMGAYQKALENPDLEWQKTDKWNAGVEMNLLNERWSITADIYLEKTSNLLSSLELPYSNGFTSYVENVGKVENRGFEIRTTTFLIRNTEQRLLWSVTGSIVHNKDKVVKLSAALKEANEKRMKESGTSPNKIIREGESQNTIYVVPSLGIDPSTGRELFRKKNGDVTYTWSADDRVAYGLSEPKYRGNFSTMFRWRDLSLNLSFAYRFGGQLYNSTLASKIENADKHYNVDRRVYYDRWKEVGDRSFFKGINDVTSTYPTSRFVQDERTLTCQNLHISYELRNKVWLEKNIGLKSLTISGDMSDLFYKSTVKQERGLSYPFSRRFSFSLSMMF